MESVTAQQQHCFVSKKSVGFKNLKKHFLKKEKRYQRS